MTGLTAGSLARGPRIGWTLAATCVGFALIQLDVTIVNVALPAIGRDLGAGIAGLQWVVDAYALVFASVLLSAGFLADRLGAKRVYAGGMALFALSSLACGLAPGTGTLIAARAVQGVGAAAMLPASLALLNHACGDDRRLRGWAIGWWTSIASVAIASGPVIGGILVAVAGWRWIFLVNLPVALVGAALLTRVADTVTTPGRRGLDLPGQGLAMLALGALTGAVIETGPLGPGNPRVVGWAAVAIVATVALVFVERRSAAPMLPGRLFRSPVVRVAMAFGAAANLSYYGILFVISLYLQEAVGFDAFHAGLAFLPLTATFLLVNALSGWVAGRHGPRWPMASGAAVAALGFALLLRLGPDSTIADMLPPFVLMPAGMGFAIPAMYTATLAAVDRDLSGTLSAVINAARQAGGVVGVAAFGALAGRRETVTAGLHHAAVTGGLLFAAFAGLMAVVLRPSR